MSLMRASSRYYFTQGDLGTLRGWRGSRGTEKVVNATFELIGPKSSAPVHDLRNAVDDKTTVQFFRWSLGIQGLEGFHWPRYLAAQEAVIVQLIFELPPKGIFLSEVSSTLEYLAPTKPLMSLGPGLRKLAEDVVKEYPSKTAHLVTSAVSNLIPARDSKNRVLWYIRRFYLAEKGSYGVEWRMTRRLIEEIGSRWTGTLGVVFVEVEETREAGMLPLSAEAKIVGRFGLKRRGKWRDWLYFRWRPIYQNERELYDDDTIENNDTSVAIGVALTSACSLWAIP